MSDYAYCCEKCPRTFKLQEFSEKHKKVHELKKQHKCDVCGFVYGAAKGLEGHMKTHTEAELAVTAAAKSMASLASGANEVQQQQQQPFYFNGFLSRQGVLAAAQEDPMEVLAKVAAASPPASPLSSASLPLPPVNNNGGSGDYKAYEVLPAVTEANCTSASLYSCAICARDFSGINSLRKHMPLHQRKVQHSCNACGHVFGKRDYLLEHLRTKHNNSPSSSSSRLECNICESGFNCTEQLKTHQRSHINWKPDGTPHMVMPFRCHVCKEIFQLSSVLAAHIKAAHPNSVSAFKCEHCPISFADVQALSRHLVTDHTTANNAATSNNGGGSSSTGKKSVFCPACNQGFTRHYNLKTHLQKMHPQFVANNFTAEEFAALTKTPGSSSSGMSPPPAMINGVSPLALPTEPALPPSFGHYFDIAKGTQMLACPSVPHCPQRFLRKTDLLIHLENDHGQKAVACTLCGEKFLQISELREHITEAHANDGADPPAVTIRPKAGPKSAKRKAAAAAAAAAKRKAKKRKSGPASRTNAPAENRVTPSPPSSYSLLSNLPEHLEHALFDETRQGFTCPDCGKTLQHKQSLLTHMKLMHSNYFGGKQWKGSQVVDMIMEESSKLSPKKSKSGPEANAQLCSVCEQVFPNPSSLRNHVVNVHIQGQNWTCDLCGKAFLSQDNLDTHIKAKHPNLNKRLQSLRDALGINRHSNTAAAAAAASSPPTKRARLDLLSSFAASSDAHKAETDDYVRVNGIVAPPEEPETTLQMMPSSMDHQMTMDEKPMFELPQHPEPVGGVLAKEEDEEEAPVASPTSSEDDDVRYEAITEAFLFESQIIYPCYVILPFVNDSDVEQMTSAKEYYEEENAVSNSETVSDEEMEEEEVEEEEEEEQQLTIDESQQEEMTQDNGNNGDDKDMDSDELHHALFNKPIDPEILSLSLNSDGNDNDGHDSHEESKSYDAEDIKIDTAGGTAGFYPNNLGDYSLPFSLSSLWKKKADILPPETLHQLEMIQKMNEIKEMNAPSEKVKPKPKSKQASSSSSSSANSTPKGVHYPTNSGNRKQVENASPGQSTIVTEYENQVQNNLWPVDCIKCSVSLDTLENLNIHMNEHWSDDKCCPVCGLLINSKRFNFKQHLKIHTGEKPFVCKVCSRSFRQKAHMVKHITTHREGATTASGGVPLSV